MVVSIYSYFFKRKDHKKQYLIRELSMKMKASGYAHILVETEFEFDSTGDTQEIQAEKALKSAAKSHGIDTPWFEFTDGVSSYEL
jgi:hypothetical protein